jgi:fatty acid desaturase
MNRLNFKRTTRLRPVEHRLAGRPDELANVLRAAHARGHLVRYGKPRQLGGGVYAIDVTILQPRRGRRLSVKRILTAAAVIAGVLAAAGLIWLLVQWVTAHLTAILVASVAGLLTVGGVQAARESGGGRR